MIRPSAPKIIHGEAFDKLCEVSNRVYHVRSTNWDLCVLAFVWAYRIMCKNLTAQVLPTLKYEARVEIYMEHVNLSPRVTTPVDMTFCIDRNEKITQLCETEHIRLEEEI